MRVRKTMPGTERKTTFDKSLADLLVSDTMKSGDEFMYVIAVDNLYSVT